MTSFWQPNRLGILLVLVVAWLAAACGQAGPGVNTQAAAPTGAGAPTAGPASGENGPATAPTAGAFAWQVEVVQNGQTFLASTSDVVLARAPFSLRVRLPQPLPIKLNVMDTDQNFLALQPGFVFTPECMQALCTGMDVAEEPKNPGGLLFVDPLSTHYLYYQSPDDHRWSRADVSPDGAVFERDVAVLIGDPAMSQGTPIEQYQGAALYLLFFVDAANPGVIDPGELQKVTLVFQ